MEQNYNVEDVLQKVSEYYGVNAEDIRTPQNKRVKVVQARRAYSVVLDILRLPQDKAIELSRTMGQWYLKQGLDDFQTMRSFRNEVRAIATAFNANAFVRYANNYRFLIDIVRERMRAMMIDRSELRLPYSASKVKERVIKAHYTKAENSAIDKVCYLAKEFMKNYGKGAEKSPMLRGHYEQGLYNPLKEIKQ